MSLDRSKSLAHLISPIPREKFFEEYFEKKFLLVPGPEDKFDDIFTWDRLNRMLNMTTIWSSKNLVLTKDTKVVPPAEYCVPAQGRDYTSIFRPRFNAIENLFAEGATLTLNGVEQLDPGIASVAASLSTAFSCVAECNVYSSWQNVKAFPPHFDVMDVFVLHLAGEKVWRIYENRFDTPSRHDGYFIGSLPDDYHEHHKGRLVKEVTLTPGDFLYIPKGVFHDALASTDASLHLTFGLAQQRGLEIVEQLLDSLPDDPLFRAPVPHPDDDEAYHAYIKKMGTRLAEIMANPELAQQLAARHLHQAQQTTPGFALPSRAYDQTFRRCRTEARLTRKGKDYRLKTGGETITVDPRAAPVIEWILDGDFFVLRDLGDQFADHPSEALMGIVSQLVDLRVIAILR